MSRGIITVRWLLCLSLIAAGLPAHACLDADDTTDHAVIEATIAPEHDGCPHHAPKAAEPQSDEDSVEFGSDCCGMNCRCGCSAPVPGLMLLGAANASPENAPTLPTASALDPSLSPEQLLRPPKPLS